MASLWWQREPLRAAVSAASRIERSAMAALLALFVLWTTVRAALQKLTMTSLQSSHALILSEIGEAATLSPTGSAGAFAARLTIGRRFGQSAVSLSVSALVVSEALATGLWLIVATSSGWKLAYGAGGRVASAALFAALVGILVTVIVSVVLVRTSRATDGSSHGSTESNTASRDNF